jgi:signal transduction histidine kinase
MTFKILANLVSFLFLAFFCGGQEIDQAESNTNQIVASTAEDPNNESESESESSAESTANEGATTLVTSIASIYEMEPAAVRSGLPVRLEGVITILDTTLWVSFIQEDSGAGIYAYVLDATQYKEGMRVSIEGKTSIGFYSPFIVLEKTTILEETAEAPSPQKALISQVNRGLFDSRFIEIEGIVRKMESLFGWVMLELNQNDSTLQVLTKPGLIEGKIGIGAKVSARGVVALKLETTSDIEERIGFQLLAQSGYGGVTVLDPGPNDLFDSPKVEMNQLRFYDPRMAHGLPLRFEAVVIWSHPNRGIWVYDGKYGMPVALKDDGSGAILKGAKVEIAGFGHDIHGRVHFEDAQFRFVNPEALNELYYKHVEFPIEKPGRLHGTPVILEGRLKSVSRWSEHDALITIYRDGNPIWIWTHRPEWMTQAEWEDNYNWQPGAELQVHGVFLVRKIALDSQFEWIPQLQDYSSGNSFNVLVDSPEQVRVLAFNLTPLRTLTSEEDQNATLNPQQDSFTIPLTAATIGAISAGSALMAGLALFFVCRYQSRLKDEIQLRDSEKLDIQTKDQLVNMAGDWVSALSVDGKILSMNEAGRQALGLDSLEMGKDVYLENFMTQAAISEFRGVFFKAKRPGKESHATEFVNLEFLPPDGSIHNLMRMEIAFIPVIEQSQLKYMMAYGKNVTRLYDLTDSLRKAEDSLRTSYEDKERLARDLHDGIVQSIFAIGLSLETCRVLIDKGVNPSELNGRLGTVSEDVNRVIREIRGYISNIESGPLSGAELKPAIKSLILTLESFEKVHFYLDIDSDASRLLTSREVTHSVFIIREAISNAIRHSEAENVTISLRRLNSNLTLEIKDDGIGFDPKLASTGSGRGLRNIYSRAREINADLEITSAPESGSSILVRLKKQLFETRI